MKKTQQPAKKATDNPREMAQKVLDRVESAAQYSNLALDTAIRRSNMSAEDRALFTTLVYGVIERKLTLDACIAAHSSRAQETLDTGIRNLLRMGIYQMLYLDRVPDHAAVNETVALAPKRARGYVNAVLRSFAKDGKRIPVPERESDLTGYLSVTYSVGVPLCETFLRELGAEKTERILAAFQRPAFPVLRVNPLRTDRDTLLRRLSDAALPAEPCRESRMGIRLLRPVPVAELPGFAEGDFFVQDEASQLCVTALDAKAGMTVLDLCACPGSKSFGAAMDMENDGRVISCDLHENKLSLVRSGADRLGIRIVETEARDAREENPVWRECADRVLCDVPCSGFGVLAKKPELRYKDPAGSRELPQIQREILRTAAAYVCPGGKLVYSTCTLLPEENERNVAAFLETNPSFSLTEMRTFLPEEGTDGFFYAVLQKK